MLGEDYTIDYERANDSTCHVVDSLVGTFWGQKWRAIPVDTGIAIGVRLSLDAGGKSFLIERFDLFRSSCRGEWCVTDSTIHITCNANPEINDTLSYLLSAGGYIYGDVEVKVLDKNRLQLENGTVLYRTE